MNLRSLLVSSLALLAVFSLGCPSRNTTQDSGTPDSGGSKFTVGGMVTGLVGTGLVLENAGADPLDVTADGAFAFATALAKGSAYNITVRTQPSSPKQTCTVEAGVGNVDSANVTSVTVACVTDTFTVGGTVSGLSGTGLVLQNNGGDDLAVSAAGAFTFAAKVASGGGYAVTVKTQPSAPVQLCTVSGGSGTVVAGNVASITVNCVATSFTVGGTVSGLSGTVVLQNNAGDDLTVNSTGTFAFATPLSTGEAYAVTVLTQPGAPSQTCTVTNGAGTVAAANVTNVAVTCTTNTFTVGGTLSGLAGTVVLRNNGGDNLSRSASGAFTFATAVSSGQAYAVTVFTQPAGQDCTVANGTGTVTNAAITNVTVTCVARTYTVGGTISGLAGTVVLQNNAGDDLARSADGAFTFATAVAFGQPYAVTVLTQPAGQSCTVANGSGTLGAAIVTNVAVTCAATPYTIGGTVTGLTSGSVVLQNNAGNNLTVSADGAFTFTGTLNFGQAYAVTILTQPAGQTCTVANGTGTVASANVTNVAVTCAATTYSVGGTVVGLSGGALVLQNNAGDDLTVNVDGSFTFATKLLSGAAYAVTIFSQPATSCSVTNGTGTIGSANVVGVLVNCLANSHTVGGAVTGLVGTLVLQNNAGNDLTLTADGTFTFTQPITSGAAYAVTVLTQPAGQTCTITNGAGTMGGADVSDVAVACTSTLYTIGGTVTGLTGTVVLNNNGGDALTLTADGTFTFATGLVTASAYAVTVATQPSGQVCTVASGSGTVATANVTNVTVTCATKYTVGGTLTGLVGTVVLRNNGGDDLSLTADGTFTFATGVATGSAYAVTVFTQPATVSCSVTSGTGTIASANVTNVAVSCVAGLTGLVINEIDYDQINADAAEFVEILNTSSAPVSLANVHLVLINGNNDAEYCAPSTGTLPGCRIALSSAGATLAAGQYLLLAPATVTVPSGALSITLSAAGNLIQNGTIEAVGLYDSAQDTLLDSLSYEGAVGPVTLGTAALTFQEGAGSTATLADSNTVAGSLSRNPNGLDTNNNATDFAFTTTITPGAANVP
ncbi:MAG: beta strand repeat-containing protein [Myxococcaceae bacterium]